MRLHLCGAADDMWHVASGAPLGSRGQIDDLAHILHAHGLREGCVLRVRGRGGRVRDIKEAGMRETPEALGLRDGGYIEVVRNTGGGAAAGPRPASQRRTASRHSDPIPHRGASSRQAAKHEKRRQHNNRLVPERKSTRHEKHDAPGAVDELGANPGQGFTIPEDLRWLAHAGRPQPRGRGRSDAVGTSASPRRMPPPPKGILHHYDLSPGQGSRGLGLSSAFQEHIKGLDRVANGGGGDAAHAHPATPAPTHHPQHPPPPLQNDLPITRVETLDVGMQQQPQQLPHPHPQHPPDNLRTHSILAPEGSPSFVGIRQSGDIALGALGTVLPSDGTAAHGPAPHHPPPPPPAPRGGDGLVRIQEMDEIPPPPPPVHDPADAAAVAAPIFGTIDVPGGGVTGTALFYPLPADSPLRSQRKTNEPMPYVNFVPVGAAQQPPSTRRPHHT